MSPNRRTAAGGRARSQPDRAAGRRVAGGRQRPDWTSAITSAATAARMHRPDGCPWPGLTRPPRRLHRAAPSFRILPATRKHVSNMDPATHTYSCQPSPIPARRPGGTLWPEVTPWSPVTMSRGGPGYPSPPSPAPCGTRRVSPWPPGSGCAKQPGSWAMSQVTWAGAWPPGPPAGSASSAPSCATRLSRPDRTAARRAGRARLPDDPGYRPRRRRGGAGAADRRLAGRRGADHGRDRKYAAGRARRRGLPYVLLNRSLPGVDADMCVADNDAGGAAVADFLVDLGHARIGASSLRSRAPAASGLGCCCRVAERGQPRRRSTGGRGRSARTRPGPHCAS